MSVCLSVHLCVCLCSDSAKDRGHETGDVLPLASVQKRAAIDQGTEVVCMCVCACVWVCVCAPVGVFVCTCVHMYACVCVCACEHMYACVHVCV